MSTPREHTEPMSTLPKRIEVPVATRKAGDLNAMVPEDELCGLHILQAASVLGLMAVVIVGSITGVLPTKVCTSALLLLFGGLCLIVEHAPGGRMFAQHLVQQLRNAVRQWK